MKRLFLIAIFAAGLIGCSSEITVQNSAGTSDKVLPVNMGHMKAYFVQTDDGYILVDTGMPDKDEQLDEAFKLAGIEPQHVKLIVITHAHPDHAGAVAYAKEITGAKVLCHESAARFIRDGKCSPIIAQNFKGKVMNAFSPEWKYQEIEPDILIKKEFDLGEYGISGKIVHTPGHTEDSITIVLDNGEMLLGDLVRGEEPNIDLGQFYEDKAVLLQSLEMVVGYNAKKIYLSHGEYIDNSVLQRTIDKL
jgi:glyoxylase-like metal-dependent hydrolase (beta-lactamase superfamily II)